MPAAARISDVQVCPKAEPGPVPHVGGPLGAGEASVLIGYMPAARAGDMAVCVGPPCEIAAGSPTVLIGGAPAARMGDPTDHAGTISSGCPTVLIGGSPQTVTLTTEKAFCEMCARDDAETAPAPIEPGEPDPASCELCDDTRQDHIDALLVVGAEGRRERIPYPRARAIICSGDDDLLALFIGSANWGLGERPGDFPADPHDSDWNGRPAGLGKHLYDHRAGGLGIAHFDKSKLGTIMERYDYPSQDLEWARDMDFNFNRIIVADDHERVARFHEWAGELLSSDANQHELIQFWSEEYYAPSREMFPDDLDRAVLNSRIRNSRSSWARNEDLLDMSFEDMQQYYIDRKVAANRSQSRAERQMAMVERTRVLRAYVEENDPCP